VNLSAIGESSYNCLQFGSVFKRETFCDVSDTISVVVASLPTTVHKKLWVDSNVSHFI